jgi:hypothetical protein
MRLSGGRPREGGKLFRKEGTKMPKVISWLGCATFAAVVFVSLTSARAGSVHFEGFENEAHSWNPYPTELQRVASGTDGINSPGGSYHLKITGLAFENGPYSYQGGSSSIWGGGWESTIDVYIDLADSYIATGEYLLCMDQVMADGNGDWQEGNLFYVGAVADGQGGYEVGVNSGHTDNDYPVTNPANYHSVPYGVFTESGWYTFETVFGPSTDSQHPDNVDVTWTVYDDEGDVFWSAHETTEGYVVPGASTDPTEVAGGNYAYWIESITADELLIDNVAVTSESQTVVPEPLTMIAVSGGMLGLGGYLRRRRAL